MTTEYAKEYANLKNYEEELIKNGFSIIQARTLNRILNDLSYGALSPKLDLHDLKEGIEFKIYQLTIKLATLFVGCFGLFSALHKYLYGC